jgi:pSer/pThr/pTyr-binding forkhead associated (FHA) protein
MPNIVKDYLEQAHQMEREAFIVRYPDPFLIRGKDESGADPRNEYCSTLKLEVNQETKEVRIAPLPPSPTDVVLPVRKTDKNSLAGKILVGRTDTNDIVVSHMTVSKHHAFFRFDSDTKRFSLTDTDSTNGTRLNSQIVPAKQSKLLRDGDQVAFGDTTFSFYTSDGFYDLLRSLSALR